jgi:hypothetical protein
METKKARVEPTLSVEILPCLWDMIFSFLELQDLKSARLTCRKWNKMSLSQIVFEIRPSLQLDAFHGMNIAVLEFWELNYPIDVHKFTFIKRLYITGEQVIHCKKILKKIKSKIGTWVILEAKSYQELTYEDLELDACNQVIDAIRFIGITSLTWTRLSATDCRMCERFATYG